MQGPADNDYDRPEPSGYEAPAIEAREPLNEPLIGAFSGGALM
jgi:hypothetical protein